MKPTYAIFVALAAIGCSHNRSSIAQKDAKQIDPEVAKLRSEIPEPDGSKNTRAAIEDYHEAFSINYLKQLLKDRPGSNVCCAPLGLAQDMAMLRECSKGQVHDAVNNLLGIGRVGSNDLAKYHAGMLTQIESDPYSTLKLANSIWIRDIYKPDPSIKKKLEAYYGCAINPFSKDLVKAKAEMDDWAQKKTDGKINGIMSTLKPTSTALWLNALVFDGKWETPFDGSETRARTFIKFDGEVEVPTMFADRIERRAAKVGAYTVLGLPFTSKKYFFIAIMPDDKAAFETMLHDLDAKWLHEKLGAMRDDKNEVQLPKLNLLTKINLKQTLTAMGAPKLFDIGLDLSPLIPSGTPPPDLTFISEAYQQVKFDLSETGVKAAALTEMHAETKAEEIVTEDLVVHIDQPFIYFVMKGRTIVLCGAVYDPSKE